MCRIESKIPQLEHQNPLLPSVAYCSENISCVNRVNSFLVREEWMTEGRVERGGYYTHQSLVCVL